MVDSSSSPVSLSAQRYADALFDVAVQSASLDGAAKLMQSFAKLLEKSQDFSHFIASPLYDGKTQENVLNQILVKPDHDKATKADKVANVVRNFFGVLIQHKRLYLLPEVIKAFADKVAKERGDVGVSVVTAEKITAEQEKELQSLLTEMAKKDKKFGKFLAGKNLILHKQVDPALLGGFVVRCGSLLIDTSLRTKLSSLKLALKEVG